MSYKIVDEWHLQDFDPSEYLDEVSTDELINEIESRGNFVVIHEKQQDKLRLFECIQMLNKMQLHDLLADVVGIQHTCDNNTILDELSKML